MWLVLTDPLFHIFALWANTINAAVGNINIPGIVGLSAIAALREQYGVGSLEVKIISRQ
ncbi:hypothetical protein [Moorena sp. SIO3I6]|uniref:hypothetical protein n=1 Tax=Moorena sp. SIO3I6 TaxID=2607831 RepID=UPI0013F75F5B|nr:hypothetical protein [Moorena sp. SIO3I6]NEP23731.1 hypothetical protein [Moorena sp. SIO3I6]